MPIFYEPSRAAAPGTAHQPTPARMMGSAAVLGTVSASGNGSAAAGGRFGAYQAIDAAVVRLAEQMPGLTSMPWPDLAEGPEQVEWWRGWLRKIWTCDPFAAAVEIASPVLAARVARACAGEAMPARQVRSAVLSVLRYRLRVASRATPFGLFAGIAPVELGTGLDVRTTNPRLLAARVDTAWLVGLPTLAADTGVLALLPVVASDLAFIRGDRLVLAFQQPEPPAARGTTVDISLRYTAAVATAMRAATLPTPMGRLAARLHDEFPTTPQSMIDRLLGELLARRFLLSAANPPATATDPLGHTLAVLRAAGIVETPEAAGMLGELGQLHTDLSAHTGFPNHRPLSASATASSTAPVLSVDLRSPYRLHLPPVVVHEAEKTADLLVRLAPAPDGTTAWRDYHARFIERFGVGGLVPLLDLVNPGIGLGFPTGYRGSRFGPVRPTGMSARDELLFDLAQTAAATRCREVELDEPLIAALTTDTTAQWVAQPHAEIRFRLDASDSGAVERGEFHLAVAGVARGAGATVGRFLNLFDRADQDRMTAAYRTLPTVGPGALLVQVSGGALTAAGENVSRAPRLLDHLLALGEYHPPGSDLVSLTDLAVTGDADRLWLVSLSQARPVELVAFHALELSRSAHPLLRFLCEIGAARAAACTPFSWGAASRLPFLPRIRHGRAILTPARWILTADSLPDTSADFAGWADAVAVWRDRFHVPNAMFLGEDDRRLALDLTEPSHLHLLRADLARTGRVMLRETPPHDAAGWIDGRVHEIVIPLARSLTATSTRPAPRVYPNRLIRLTDSHLPGHGDWLYVKLYAEPDQQPTILTSHLADLWEEWDTTPLWWLLRYQDPEQHVRLRIRLTDPDEFGAAASRVGRWAAGLRRAGLLHRIVFDTYQPETGRFGTGPAMAAAEAVFAADSAAAVAQLTTSSTHRAHLYPLAAASLLDLTASCLPGIDPAVWLVNRLPRAHGPGLDRDLHRETLRLADPHHDWEAIRGLPGGEQILASWSRRRQALADYQTALTATDGTSTAAVLPALLHLHQFRMTGPSSDTELLCARLARAAALRLVHRTGRTP
ncbi:class I lanthipeptide synthase [Frankia sp. AiPs1]|uniref:lantibiotic dehydratase n=1 Tax=Frankia sp. AiPa1 TaxID=573492 RepID=UPI00202B3442|nr:lantibiotic dehydratase [Frankia sp. AiPa1]MCL9760407.1 lantibiotic dehydratase [Frankia sp. AiPa1]